jgi:hypothetical protein
MTFIYKPNETSIKQALEEAETLREQGKDYADMAHSLLYFAELCAKQADVIRATKEYLHFGEDVALHQRLVKALEKLDDYEDEAEKGENTTFGLD